MELLYAIVVGVLFGVSAYLLMHRELLRVVVGIVLLTHAANLLLFLAGDVRWTEMPLFPLDPEVTRQEANPLIQALILTSIVIGLGVQIFVLALARATVAATGTQHASALEESERSEP